MQLQPVNDALWAELATVGVAERTPAWHGVRRALGVGPAEAGDKDTFPVYAFSVAALSLDPEAPVLVLFLATPGRLIRYEWTKAAAVTATFPIEKIAAVEETERGAEFSVAIHIDSHARLAESSTETRTLTTDEGPVLVTQGRERSEGLTYRITVGAETAITLAEFSRRLRLLMGL